LLKRAVITKFIEATNAEGGGGINWGKFVILRFDEGEWAVRAQIDGSGLVGGRGWSRKHLVVFDLQTGEGAMFLPGGSARADLAKHKIWVCPMFESFLVWLYRQPLDDLDALPSLVKFAEEEAPSAMAGYRRSGDEQLGDE